MSTLTSARWWRAQGDQVVCHLCPRECAMHAGQRGFCFVRQNVGGQMELTTYGRSTGFCIDPIEKKPLNHFLPGTPVLSFGTAGCNLGCKFCQNWSISKSREIDLLAEEATPEAIAQAALQSGCRSVAFTYNDPVIWAEYAMDTARACRAVGIKTVAVTAGYITPEARPDFYAEMDAANVDLKGFTESFYQHLTLSHLEPVLDTLRWLKHESDVWFEITNLMIPGENDAEDETRQMCNWIAENLGPDVPVHFTAFHPDFRMRDVPKTPPATLTRARKIALEAGLHFPYVGNVNDQTGQSTYCPNCHACLIERDGYKLGRWRMTGANCAGCGHSIPGVFEERPGDWGPKRQPIRIHPAVTQPVLVPLKTMTDRAGTSPDGPPAVPPGIMPNMLSSAPRIDFTADECDVLLSHTRALAASILSQMPPPFLPGTLSEAETYGIFVTFHRQAELRACRGRFGNVGPLGEMLAGVVSDTVLEDPRFPAISASELPVLSVDISLMHSPATVDVKPLERPGAIEIGRHGLVLNHPRGKGLLLPQVATEHRWNRQQFLEALAQKAGLPADAWKDPAAKLMTFEARIVKSPAPDAEPDLKSLTPADFARLRDIIEAVAARGPQSAEGVSEALHAAYSGEWGLAVQTQGGRLAVSIATDQPLAQLAANIGTSFGKDGEARRIHRLTVFARALSLRPVDHPHRHGNLPRTSAIVVKAGPRWTLQLPVPPNTGNLLNTALAAMGTDVAGWRNDPALQVTAYTSIRSETVEPTADRVRAPARAGQFYPELADELRREVQQSLSVVPAAHRRCRAILLPHAGWVFCGEIIGRTLAQVEIPRTVIVIGPKHTPHGADWSVSSASTWAYPGAEVPVAVDLREKLAALIPNIVVESEAHRVEHAVEVLVPFLHARQPELRILPIVLGPTSFAQTERIARALAALINDTPEPVLLVISSDLNHFANEDENRRRDQMAVEAFCTGDPGRLFDVVHRNSISMCGVIPAVTVLRTLEAIGPAPRPQFVAYSNSASLSGDFERVVGYAGCVVE